MARHRLWVCPVSDSCENRTIFLGVKTELAESSSDDAVPPVCDVVDEAEFFREGSSNFDILRCSRVENCDIDTLALLVERGVDGVVDVVIVDSDTLESDGVGGTD